MATAIDGVELLRSLARELDHEADTAGARCPCPTHLVTRMVLSDLAATYRTRALHWLAAAATEPEPANELRTAQERLYEALERASRWHANLRETGVGPLDTRGLFGLLASILDAHHTIKRLV
jgi:hypothetical protein